MEPKVPRELGVERGQPDGALSDEHGPTVMNREHLDPLEAELFEDKKKIEKRNAEKKESIKQDLREADLSKGHAYIVWRDHGDPPKRELTKDRRIKTKTDHPRSTVWHIIKDNFNDGDVRTIHYYNNGVIEWDGLAYRAK